MARRRLAAEVIDSPCRILIGATTLQYLGQQFQTQYVGEVHLKGKAQTTTIYRVLGEQPDRTPIGLKEDKGMREEYGATGRESSTSRLHVWSAPYSGGIVYRRRLSPVC